MHLKLKICNVLYILVKLKNKKMYYFFVSVNVLITHLPYFMDSRSKKRKIIQALDICFKKKHVKIFVKFLHVGH